VDDGTREPVAAAAEGERGQPHEHILDFFNTWSRKTEELNIWFNRK
jgi:hypothetical protein